MTVAAKQVSWLTRLPTNWKVMSLDKATDPIRRITYGIVQAGPPVDEGRFMIRGGDYSTGWAGPETILKVDPVVESRYARARVRKGDVVLTIVGAGTGNTAVVPDWLDGANLTQTTARVAPNHAVATGSYLSFLLQSGIGRSYADQYMKGAAQPGLNLSHIAKWRVPVPPLSTQKAIADFLDRKTAAIDELIAKKQRLLDLLAEKRAALINQAVTKGLDPSVPMKDSGIPWIGEIPEHWEVKRLKHLTQVRGGVTKGQKHDGHATTSMPYLRVANVQDGHLDLEQVHEIEVRVQDVERYRLQPGDILMNEGGDNDKLGRGAVWEGEIEPCLHQNHVFAVRPGLGVDPYWVNLTTQASYLKHFFFRRANQSTNLASISASNLKEAPIIWPPSIEQNRIKEWLASWLEALSGSSSKLEHQVERLREYRQALITAAVTGQLNITEEAAA